MLKIKINSICVINDILEFEDFVSKYKVNILINKNGKSVESVEMSINDINETNAMLIMDLKKILIGIKFNEEPSIVITDSEGQMDIKYAKIVRIKNFNNILIGISKNEEDDLVFKNLDINSDLIKNIEDKAVKILEIDSEDLDFRLKHVYGTYPNECVKHIIEFN